MRLLWLCNLIPGTVQQAIDGTAGNGLWIDHTLEDLLADPEMTVCVLCRGPKACQGSLGQLSYRETSRLAYNRNIYQSVFF